MVDEELNLYKVVFTQEIPGEWKCGEGRTKIKCDVEFYSIGRNENEAIERARPLAVIHDRYLKKVFPQVFKSSSDVVEIVGSKCFEIDVSGLGYKIRLERVVEKSQKERIIRVEDVEGDYPCDD